MSSTPAGRTLAGSAALDQEERQEEEAIERILAEAGAGRAATKLPSHQRATVEIGSTLSVIMREAAVLERDIVAMGTRRRTTYLGSHAADTLFW